MAIGTPSSRVADVLAKARQCYLPFGDRYSYELLFEPAIFDCHGQVRYDILERIGYWSLTGPEKATCTSEMMQTFRSRYESYENSAGSASAGTRG